MVRNFFIIFFLFFLLVSCSTENIHEDVFEGSAQGTSFHIKLIYSQSFSDDYVRKKDIKKWLSHYNRIASPWDNQSEISNLNSGDTVDISPELFELCQLAIQMKQQTNGILEPTLEPIIDGWGFGINNGYLDYNDSSKVQSLMKLVGNDDWLPTSTGRWAWPKSIKLNFMSLAQGHCVDIIIDSLRSRGVYSAFVEVGGEIRTYGKKSSGDDFTVGIERPALNKQDELQVIIPLRNRALATSGNYRNFRVDPATGIKFGHTISAFTGWPIQTEVLSSTIIGPSCAMADALATAFLAMGLNKSKLWLDQNPEWDAYLIYIDEKGNFRNWTTLSDL
jgi:thiamine biosynthesis lipoprotein